ncbi:MAG: T9SS type A sorting domain-containing protein [Bacteroidota bacterium]|nr:MAG: T9SS type A sorting domain-containing protein [Bacteroidota bacterium]
MCNPGVSYQWVSCPSYSPITGATAPSFTPDANGQYACITSNGGCFDTSACATVNGVGITDVKDVITISCFPNPAFDILNLQSSVDLGRTRLSITTATGVVIKEVHYKLGTTSRIDVSSLASGIYFIEVANGDKNTVQSL